jgi:hypothetical protein
MVYPAGYRSIRRLADSAPPLERDTCEHEFPFSLRRTMRLALASPLRRRLEPQGYQENKTSFH